jgi:DNA-binding MarR family transcriptional regulator
MCAHARNCYGVGVAEPDRDVDAWRALLLAHAGALRAIEDDLTRERVIPLGWYDVLLELNAAPERRMRMSVLADHVVLSRTRVSRLVDELARAGLVERRPDPSDGRSSFAVLTPAGRRELRKAAPLYLAGIERHFTSLLDDGERKLLATALQKVADHHRRQQGRR